MTTTSLARVPLVERAFGQDRPARRHRWTGCSSLHPVVAHIVLIERPYGTHRLTPGIAAADVYLCGPEPWTAAASAAARTAGAPAERMHTEQSAW
ncbi:hypothetical protein [Dactylosporangium matsuzakiense]|uniref:Uncharacterized protein n=1 Tax=Dactylosporangium matsuzakiense TaxID=53360 RepID=A0A9W6KTI4_9ACTN|nr:hypothetical protein [Dactylosporangium matsuzakiense]GLL06922.1 hypothetical protein GCM10017581_086720 [Dactylosporangium matsuzakiense]